MSGYDEPMTRPMIDGALDHEVALNRRASEAEVDHYRKMNVMADLAVESRANIDALLDKRAALDHGEEPIDPSDPAVVASIAAAWAGMHGDEPDPGRDRAMYALRVLTVLSPTMQGVTELPGLIQDEHGCWISDPDDPRYVEFALAGVGLGCAETW